MRISSAFRRAADFGAYNDRSDCPHLGDVFRGKVRFVYSDGREEIVSAGETYYVRPGHKFEVLEDAETVEFSPSAPYRQHLSTVARNMAADTASREMPPDRRSLVRSGYAADAARHGPSLLLGA